MTKTHVSLIYSLHIDKKAARPFSWLTVLIIILFSWSYANAVPSGLTFQGRIVLPNGLPLESSHVELTVKIVSPNASACVLFEETHILNFSGSDGVFSIQIGAGSRSGDDPGLTLSEVLSNTKKLTGLNCAIGNTYEPLSEDPRHAYVSLNDGSGLVAFPTPYVIRSVPYALETETISGYRVENLCRVEDNGTPQNVSPLSSNDFLELLALINGTSSKYSRISPTGGTSVTVVNGDPANPAEGSIWYDSSTGSLKFRDANSIKTVGTSGGSVTSITAGDGLTGGTITTSGTIALENFGTPGTYYKVQTDPKGRVISGSTSLHESDIPTLTTAGKVSGFAITSGTIGGSASINTTGSVSSSSISTRVFDLFDSDNSNRIRLQTPATGVLTSDYSLTLPPTAGAPGQVLATDGSGGLSWVSGVTPSGNAGGDLTGTYPNPSLANVVTPGTGTKITYDAKGRVIASSSLDAADIPNLSWTKITSDKPTTLAGYGISDAVVNAGQEGPVTIGSNDSAPLFLKTNATVRMTIDPDGKVGVGTTSPRAMMDLWTNNAPGTWPSIRIGDYGEVGETYHNNLFFIGINASLSTSDDNNGNKFRPKNDQGTGLVMIQSSSGPGVGGVDFYSINWNSDPSEKRLPNDFTHIMRIDHSGNVGVGTKTPSEKLEVAGKIKATEVCIGADCRATWPAPGNDGTITSITAGTGLVTSPAGGITESGTIGIAPGGVTANELASNSVTTVKIQDGAVTGAKLETIAGLTSGTYGSATEVPQITVDEKGRVTAVTSTAITGLLPSPSGANGKFLKSDGNSWAAENIRLSDIKNSTGNSAFNTAACLANQTVKWSSLLDTFECQDIGSLDASKITTGTIDSARLPASATVWQKSGSDISYTGGNVGIGTASPGSKLDIDGQLRLYTTSSGAFVDHTAGTNLNLRTTQNTAVSLSPNNQNRLTVKAGWGGNGTISNIVNIPYWTESNVVSLDRVTSLEVNYGRSAGNISNTYAIYIPANSVVSGGGSVVNAYGMYLEAPTGANNNYAAAFLGGNIGIGTTTPAAKLDVKGVIKSAVGGPWTDPAGNAIDFASGNTQDATFTSCPGNSLVVNLYSVFEGASYSLVLNVPAGCVVSFTGTTAAYGEGGGTAITAFKFPGGVIAASTGFPMVFSFLRANNVAYGTQIVDLK